MTETKNTFQYWLELADKELRDKSVSNLNKTYGELDIKPFYSEQDIENDAQEQIPGQEPFKRGIRASMYANRPWTIRQYAGFSTAKESNEFYRKALSKGQKGLSIAFDLATHRGYDSDHPRVAGDVGKAGVAIDTVEDMKILFDGIPLDQMSVSMTMNGAVIPIMAMFIVAGQEQGVATEKLSGTIQNDILKEFMVRNTYIYPPEPSMRIVSDIIEYTSKNMPSFNSISISGYHMHEAGATAVQELAYTLADGMEYVRAAKNKGLNVDNFAGRLSFFFGIGMNFFIEICKLRAARVLWSRIMTDFGAQKAKSKMLRTHCQTSGVSLTEQDPYNNIIRTAYEAMAAALGGTQSLHTNAFDEAIALPTETSARIARNTQLILQHETKITDVVDPLGGSYYIEHLTKQIADEAWKQIQEIEQQGGMTKAVMRGDPKLRIEETAAIRQTKIDKAEEVIVGVNRFTLEDEEPIDILDIDTVQVKAEQVKRLQDVKNSRDESMCQEALNSLIQTAETGDGNLLEAAVHAAKSRATLGEISLAMEKVFNRHKATAKVVSGVYGKAYENDPEYQVISDRIAQIKAADGNAPHVLIAKMGQDGHDRGAKVIATAFADLGFEVSLSSLFEMPQEIAEQAIESKVQVIGISSLAAGHKTLVPELIEELKKRGHEEIIIVCGGVIPEQDYQFLYDAGVAEIFGPGSNVIQTAHSILNNVEGIRHNR